MIGTPRPPGGRRGALGFAAAVAALAVLLIGWAAGTGRYGGPDEPAHVLRAYAVAHGEVIGERADVLTSGYRVVWVPERLASGDPACYRHSPTVSSACAAATGGDGLVWVATSAGINPPLYYALVGGLVRLVGDPADSTSYRLAAAALVLAVLAVALARLRPWRGTGVLVLAALTPSAWFLFGVVNPNGLEVALVLLAWVGVARWLDAGDPAAAPAPGRPLAAAAWIAVPLSLAIAIRPVALMAAAAVLAVVERGRRPTWRQRAVLWGALVPAVVSLVVWNRIVGLELDDPRTAAPGAALPALWTSLGDLPSTVGELVGSLGWLEYRVPWPVQLVWWVALAGAVVAVGRTAAPPHRRAVWWAWGAVVLLVPVVFEVVLRGHVGPIWQGRYSLPAFLGVGALVLARARDVGARVIVTVGAVAATAEVTTYWTVVRRAAVGTDGAWWPSGGHTSSALLSPGAWLGVHVATVVAVAAVSGRALLRTPHAVPGAGVSRDVAEDVDDHVGAAGEVEHVEATAGAELEVGLVGHGYAGAGVHRRRVGPRRAARPRSQV